MDNAVERQRAIYGASLAERFGSVMKTYGLSQRSLARVLGISAPMLSQLIGGHRIKIGNPAVHGRLLMLESRAGESDLARVLREVAETDPATATHSTGQVHGAADPRQVAEYLRALADPEVLRQLAERAAQMGAASLAGLLEQAGTGRE